MPGREISNNRIITDYATNQEGARNTTADCVAQVQADLLNKRTNARVFGPYGPRDLFAGDPASPSGTKVELSELADDVLALLLGGGAFPTTLTNMIAISYAAEYDNGSSGAAKTIDWNNGQKQYLLLTADTTLTFTDLPGPANVMFRVQQDGTGGWNITWPSNVKWRNASPPNLGVGQQSQPDRVSLVALYYNGTDYYAVATTNFIP